MIPEFLHTTFGQVAAVVGFLGFLWAAYQVMDGVRGVYFQTFPELHVVGSDARQPFALPFSVKNPSGWLSIKSVDWSCVVAIAESPAGTLHDVETSGGIVAAIKPGEFANFRCSIGGMAGLTAAKIFVTVRYKTLWWQREPLRVEFNWISGRWVEGPIF